MNQITIKSPAKVNLYLEVKDLRQDGYHNIDTVFQKITLYDEITLSERSKGINLICDNKDVPANHCNLAYKAARLLNSVVQGLPGIEISIKKIIPVAGGLGGGSSNAASVLLGLKNLWQIKVSQKRLMELGRVLGADVPFFISGFGTAMGKERGDRLTPIANNLSFWLVLVNPGINISTKKVYNGLAIGLTKDRGDVKIISHAIREGSLNMVCRGLYNRLEESVTKRCKVISQIMEKLRSFGAMGVAMSGSGPTVYGITSTREEAMRLRDMIAREGWSIFIARNVNCAERGGSDGDN